MHIQPVIIKQQDDPMKRTGNPTKSNEGQRCQPWNFWGARCWATRSKYHTALFVGGVLGVVTYFTAYAIIQVRETPEPIVVVGPDGVRQVKTVTVWSINTTGWSVGERAILPGAVAYLVGFTGTLVFLYRVGANETGNHLSRSK